MSWGQVGAGVASAFAGNALGGGGGGSSSTTIQQSRAQPFRVGGGLFTANFGAGLGRGTLGVPGSTRRQRRRGGGGGGRTIPPGFVQVDSGAIVPQNSRPANQLNIIARAGQRARDGSGGGGGGGSRKMGLQLGFDPRVEAIMGQGLFNAGTFLDQAANSEAADIARSLGVDFLNQVGATDPLAVAQNQFDLISPLLQSQFDEQNLDFENRLFAQGRLGSTEGARDINAIRDSQNDARRALLADSFQQGLAAQAHVANLGTSFAQLDPQLRGLFTNLASNSANIPLAFQNAALQQAQLGGALAGAQTSGTLSSPGQSITNQIGAGLVNSGVNQLNTGLNNVFTNFANRDPGGAPNRGTGITGGGR